MADFIQLPATLNISAVAGDDVQMVVTVTPATDCSSVISIANMTFAAAFKTSNLTYNATTSANSTTGKVTVTWSDSQTTAAGAGSYKWWMTFTDSDITKTRLAGNFLVIPRG